MSKYGDDDRRGRGPGKPGDRPYGQRGDSARPYRGAGAGAGAGAGGDAKARGPRVERFGRDDSGRGGERPSYPRRDDSARGGERPSYPRRDDNRGGPERPRYNRDAGSQAEGERRPAFKRSEDRPYGDRKPRPEGRYVQDSGTRAPKRYGRDDAAGERRPPRPPREDRFYGERPPREAFAPDRPRRDDRGGDRPPRREFRDRNEGGFSRPPREGFRKSGEFSRDGKPRRDAREQTGSEELRQYGWNACMATYQKRPEAVRKVFLHTNRVDAMREILQELAERQIGYRVVENEDLEKLTQTQHHEGVCFEVIPPKALSLDQVLTAANDVGKQWFVWLDGVGNPHNLGAILRSAAHFGCAGVIVLRDSQLKISGAAARVAEGAAEFVPMVRIGDARGAIEKLRGAGFKLLATSVRAGDSLFTQELPDKCVWLLGAEGEGVSSSMEELADQTLRIPGTGQVESLNVAAAFAVLAAETHRAHTR